MRIDIPDETKNDTLIRLETLLKERNWTVYKLAKESEIPFSSLNNLFHRNNEPSLSTLRKICKGFNISLSDFFSDEPSVSPTDYTLEERTLVENYRSLSKSNKKLLQVYSSGLVNGLPFGVSNAPSETENTDL